MRRLLILASAIVFVDTMFFASITPLLPRYAEELDLSKPAAGILSASYAAGTLVAAVPAGLLAARIGVRVTTLIGLGLLTGSSVVFAWADGVVVLDVARFVQGVGGAASWAGALAWLIGSAPEQRRGELIGVALGAAIGGALFGPVLGGLAEVAGPEITFTGVGGLGLALLAVSARTGAPPPSRRGSVSDLVSAVGEPRVLAGMWLIVLPGLLFGTLGVLVPLRLDELGAGAVVIAGAFLAAGALEATVSPLVGRVSDRLGRLAPSLAGLGLSAVVMASLPWPEVAWLVVALLVLAAPVIGILWAPATALASDGANARGVDQALAFGLVNLSWGLGQTAGAAGGAQLGEAAGDAAPYLLLAATCALTLLVLRHLEGRLSPRAPAVPSAGAGR